MHKRARRIYVNMCVFYSLIILYVCVIFFHVSAENNSSLNEPNYLKYFKKSDVFNTTNISNSAKEVISQAMTEKCSQQYSITCFKLDLSKLLDKLEATKSFQIFPGILLINTNNSNSNATNFPNDVAISLVRSGNGSNELNSYLRQKIGHYLKSLTVRVNLLDNPIIQNLKQLTYSTYNYIFNPSEETGRGTKKGKQDYQAALWSAAMLAALGLSGLAALAGKAFLTGALALVLSIACLLKGCHRGHKAAHYEIITKPAHLHDVEHIGLTSGLSSSPYTSYARHLIQDRIIPAILDTDTSEEREVETKVIPVHAYQIAPNIAPHPLIHR